MIHTHPEYAIAFSSLGKELSPMSNDGTMFSAGVPIFSETTDLIIDQARGKAVAKCLGQGSVVILRNHGIVAAGSTIEHAVFLAIKLERACRIQMLAEQAGGPKLFVKPEELAAKRGRTNRGDSQGNASAIWCAAGTCVAIARCRRSIRRRSKLRPQRIQERLAAGRPPRAHEIDIEVDARADDEFVGGSAGNGRRPVFISGENFGIDAFVDLVLQAREDANRVS